MSVYVRNSTSGPKKARARRWKEYSEGRFIAKTSPDFPTRKHCDTLGELTRKGGSVWTQLKTGHIGLNSHLCRIKVMDSARCPRCNKYEETVEHFLLHCEAYKQERRTLKRKVKGGLKKIRRVLGDHRNAQAVVDYVFETGRLRWARGERGGQRWQGGAREGADWGTGRNGGRRRGGIG